MTHFFSRCTKQKKLSHFDTKNLGQIWVPPEFWHRLAKLSILILEGIIKKISYERRDSESVDEKSLS